MNIRILCVGKIKEKFYRDAIDEYVKRLDRAVSMAKKNKQFRRDYMTLYQHDLEIKDLARYVSTFCT